MYTFLFGRVRRLINYGHGTKEILYGSGLAD